MPPEFFREISPNGKPNDFGRLGAVVIVLIFILGLVIRLFACQHTVIVNPDGVYYIHQARAIYYGEWNSLTSCGVSFLSNYPFYCRSICHISSLDCCSQIRFALFWFNYPDPSLFSVQAFFRQRYQRIDHTDFRTPSCFCCKKCRCCKGTDMLVFFNPRSLFLYQVI